MIRFPITIELLQQYNACDIGMREVAALLPLDISTNAFDNYSLAVQLINLGQAHRIWWLLDKVATAPDEQGYSGCDWWWSYSSKEEPIWKNPEQLATLLALFALIMTNEE